VRENIMKKPVERIYYIRTISVEDIFVARPPGLFLLPGKSQSGTATKMSFLFNKIHV